MKFNADEIPSAGVSSGTTAWHGASFKIEPVRLRRARRMIDPQPPDLRAGDRVAIWVNDQGDLGGLIAFATVAAVERVGSRCRLTDVSMVPRIGLDRLGQAPGAVAADLYTDIDANRRSKVRLLSQAQWDVLADLAGAPQKSNTETADTSALAIDSIAQTLNERAHGYAIGRLQAMRAELHGRRKHGNTIFGRQTIHPTYAFHWGGRNELQFNIGIEPSDAGDLLRYGVAFSFETSRSFPDPLALKGKVRLFNDYLEAYPDVFADFAMWTWDGEVRGADHFPSAITPEELREGLFVFVGARCPAGEIDYHRVLSTFDSLLPLYRFVESNAQAPLEETARTPFAFRAGHKAKARTATVSVAARDLVAQLRHEDLQRKLYKQLARKYGAKNVGTERPSGCGTRIDAVVRRDDRYWFYEIKTSSSPRACMRDAIGQLLEYSLWPGGQEAARLFVVGEAPLDADGKAYLAKLKSRFQLPLDYLSISMDR